MRSVTALNAFQVYILLYELLVSVFATRPSAHSSATSSVSHHERSPIIVSLVILHHSLTVVTPWLPRAAFRAIVSFHSKLSFESACRYTSAILPLTETFPSCPRRHLSTSPRSSISAPHEKEHSVSVHLRTFFFLSVYPQSYVLN
jgi:hypothetical protein